MVVFHSLYLGVAHHAAKGQRTWRHRLCCFSLQIGKSFWTDTEYSYNYNLCQPAECSWWSRVYKEPGDHMETPLLLISNLETPLIVKVICCFVYCSSQPLAGLYFSFYKISPFFCFVFKMAFFFFCLGSGPLFFFCSESGPLIVYFLSILTCITARHSPQPRHWKRERILSEVKW